MPRKPGPPISKINLHINENDRVRLDLLLFSDLEGRVPLGGYSRFFTERIREFFLWETLNLEPFGFPPGFFIRGPKEMVAALSTKLKEPQHAA